MLDSQPIKVLLTNSALFGVQISSLKGLNYGFDIFVYILCGMGLITFVYNMYKPYSSQKENKMMFEKPK
jgi:hypothetical protein